MYYTKASEEALQKLLGEGYIHEGYNLKCPNVHYEIYTHVKILVERCGPPPTSWKEYYVD